MCSLASKISVKTSELLFSGTLKLTILRDVSMTPATCKMVGF